MIAIASSRRARTSRPRSASASDGSPSGCRPRRHPAQRATVSGDEVNAALIGTPYVVSSGKLTVAVTAPGYLPYSSELDVPEGGSADIDVHLTPDPSAQPCPEGRERIQGACVLHCAAGLVARGDECVAALPPSSAPAATPMLTRAIAGIAIGGVGVVLAGLGAYFGAEALSKNSDSTPYCNVGGVKNACYGAGVSLRSDAVHDATLSTILIGVGAASVAGGLTLWITAPSAKASASVGFDGRYFHVGGVF